MWDIVFLSFLGYYTNRKDDIKTYIARIWPFNSMGKKMGVVQNMGY